VWVRIAMPVSLVSFLFFPYIRLELGFGVYV
jgi:hypothetical protein